jgi:predicted nucleic-acid-binding protein
MRAVDTNVLVRLVVRDDPRQTAAAERFVAAGAWVSHLVLMEAVWVLATRGGLDPRSLASAVQMVLDNDRLSIENHDSVAAALGAYAKQTGVSFADCLILEAARRAGHLPLGTFDRRFARLDGAQEI